MNFRTRTVASVVAVSLAGMAFTAPASASTPSSPAEIAQREAANEQQLAEQRAQMASNAEARAAYEAAVADHAQQLAAWRTANAASEEAEVRYEQAMAAYREKYGAPSSGSSSVSGTY